MSKDVIIAGAIVAACLGMVTVAFVVPKSSKKISTSTTPSLVDSLPSGNNNDFNPIPSPAGSETSPLPNYNAISGNSGGYTQPPAYSGSSGQTLADNGKTHAPIFNPFDTKARPPVNNNGMPPNGLPPVNVIDHGNVKQSGEAKTHVVAAGETLGEISMKYYGTSKYWKKIEDANKTTAEELKVGQKLSIPVVEKPQPKTGTDATVIAAGENIYAIKSGDSYYTIAKTQLGNANRWKDIEKLNGIPSEELQVGQKIKLPAKESAVTPPANNNTSTANDASGGNVHVVAAGETLGEISKKYFGTSTRWKDIVKANPGVDPEGLKVGQKLKLPEGAHANANPASMPDSVTPPVTGVGDYTVKAHDTFQSIADKELGKGADWKKIAEANPGVDSAHLRVGQKLKIPGKKPKEDAPAAPTGGKIKGLGPSTPAPVFPPSTFPTPIPSPTYPSPTGSTPTYPPANTFPGYPAPTNQTAPPPTGSVPFPP